MCGICGKMVFQKRKVEKSLLERMCSTMVHRGPDGRGIYTAPFIGLGQQRLAIIDLNRQADPPLPNEDETVWLVYNGELYNYQSLRVKLEAAGHRFRTQSDTEVIIHLYEEHGTDCLSQMRGMFAFALWDESKKRLFAARDRLGQKPFFYTVAQSSFVFASEIKAITVDPDVSIEPDYYAIDQYLTWQYVPSPYTAFWGIRKLPPGCYLTCTTDARMKIVRYWEPPIPRKTQESPDEIQNHLISLIDESVRLRMISDVPIGVFLSGGIDSAAIVAFMARHSRQPVKTFSIGLEEDEYNELPYARLTAERYGTDHHEFVVRPDAVELLPLLVRHYNEPFADSSALPTYYVSQMTRQNVTVALSGDGGDESFTGYTRYAWMKRWQSLDVLPSWFRTGITTMPKWAMNPFYRYNLPARLSRGLEMVRSNLIDRYRMEMSIFKSQEKRQAYTSHFWGMIRDCSPTKIDPLYLTKMPEEDSIDWMMRHDQNFYLPDCLMVKTDIASMANSLEVRCPFLDHPLVEYTASIPSNMKLNGSIGKKIFRKSVENLLPVEILNKQKTGFGIPLGRWFRGGLWDILREALLDDRAVRRGLFEPSFLTKLIDEQRTGRRDWSYRLWSLLFLELWFREFID
ncbi:MAG: asparagine synthase (glutamine-hydrolyzing) [Sedimentisphaerales bacterium]|nr:asparagine synthase (glutamine-hydrolyzing) [Sedimentisphaerales bacterium]